MSEIALAVKILRAGGLVAFPTETVYGLGADATNAQAVRKIFAAKGRPGTNPLIVHVADATVGKRYAAVWPDLAEKLAKHFWPGPLTLVVAKQTRGPNAIVNEATAGLATVGLRAPDHPLTLQLLKEFDGPLAGPSANRSTRISPTTAADVRAELGDGVDLILDGGPSHIGIESTVLDLTRPRPAILRPGAITRQQIESLIGSVDWRVGTGSADQAQSSPGQHAVHYSPMTPAFRFNRGETPNSLEEACIVISFGPADVSNAHHIAMPTAPGDYARMLYGTLRQADELGVGRILIEMPPDAPEWAAIRDRLMRATKPVENDTKNIATDKNQMDTDKSK